MNALSIIREQILRKYLAPTLEDIRRADRYFKRIRTAVKHYAKNNQLKTSFIKLEGSAGSKQTQLRNSRELDIFIGLPQQLLIEEVDSPHPTKTVIRKFLGKLVRKVAYKAAEQAGCKNIRITHAEHPYVSAVLDDYQVDLVFCFDLPLEYISEKGPITAVDRTPHHSRFVSKHLSTSQRDDVRLLKAFFQSGFVYGDTSPVGRSGFTGFSAEILIYHTQNLTNALRILKHLSLKPFDFFGRSVSELRNRFPNEHLIIIDPIDPNRNLAASISKRAHNYACHLAGKILTNPEQHYFLPRDVPVLSSKEEQHLEPNYLVVSFDDKTGWHYTKTRDKMYKYFNHLCNFLGKEATGEVRFGRCLFEEVFSGNAFAVALYIELPLIKQTFLREGPPSELDEGISQFLSKHPNAVLQAGRYYAETRRPFTHAEEAVRYYLGKHRISHKLHLTSLSRTGTQKICKQSLWILKNAVIPFLD
jgi:tRNA nucleotidyltransferase (CCA-adding enzyme)